jgi:hypothetical protein
MFTHRAGRSVQDWPLLEGVAVNINLMDEATYRWWQVLGGPLLGVVLTAIVTALIAGLLTLLQPAGKPTGQRSALAVSGRRRPSWSRCAPPSRT